MTSTSEIPAFITQMDNKLMSLSGNIFDKSTYGLDYSEELDEWNALELFIFAFGSELNDWTDKEKIERAEKIQVRFGLIDTEFIPVSP